MFKRRYKRLRKRSRERAIRWHIFYGVLALVTVAFFGYAVWYITHMPFFTISNIVVVGGETVSHDEIKEVAEKELVGNYFLLIPKRFEYTYPHDRIVEALNSIPRVHDVSVERENRNTLTVSFGEYVPHALWCVENTNTPCVFLTKDGYAFADAPALTGGAFVRNLTPGRTVEARTQAFTTTDMERMDALIIALGSQFGFRVATIEHTTGNDEVYTLTNGARLFIAPQISVQETFDDLRSVLESAEYKHLINGNFNYIDLRFGSRVFVNEEVASEPQDEVATSTEETLPNAQ